MQDTSTVKTETETNMSTTFITIDGTTHRFAVHMNGECFLNSILLPIRAEVAENQYTATFVKYAERVYLIVYDNLRSVLQFYNEAGRCVISSDIRRVLGEHTHVYFIHLTREQSHMLLLRRGDSNLKFSLEDAFTRVLESASFERVVDVC
jgi:hypothetical protein